MEALGNLPKSSMWGTARELTVPDIREVPRFDSNDLGQIDLRERDISFISRGSTANEFGLIANPKEWISVQDAITFATLAYSDETSKSLTLPKQWEVLDSFDAAGVYIKVFLRTWPEGEKGLINFCKEKEAIRFGYVLTKTSQDIGLLEINNKLASTKIMRIPAAIFCYWLGESEIAGKSILVEKK